MFQHIWKIWLDFCVVDHIILLLEKKGVTIFETVTDSVVIWSSCYMKWGCRNYILVSKNKPTINFAFSGKSICNDKYFSILIFYLCISVSWTFDCVLIRSIKIMLQWLRNKLRNILSVICIDTFTISFLTSGHSEDKVWSSFYTQPLDMANPPSLYPFPNHLLLTTLFLQ